MAQTTARRRRTPADGVEGDFDAVLCVVGAGHADESAVVGRGGVVVGRDPSCDLVLGSPYVDPRHARVSADRGEYFIEDLGSVNGTRLDGRSVTVQRQLTDGAWLAFADVAAEFRLARRSEGDGGGWTETPAVAALQLVLAVVGSFVSAVLNGFLLATAWGQWGVLLGAAVGPVVTTTFTTKVTGEKGRLRAAVIAALSITAVLITFSGVEVVDRASGTALLAGGQERQHSFPWPAARPPPPTPDPTTVTGLGVTAQPDLLDCGSLPVGSAADCAQRVTVTSTGTDELLIDRFEVNGPHNADFTVVGDGCLDEPLATGKTCQIAVRYRPGGIGQRRATLTIHQNLPPPDLGTDVALNGVGTDAAAPPAQVSVTVKLRSPGSAPTGIVTSTPAGIACPSDCQASFPHGSTVRLTLTSPLGARPVDWKGCDTATATRCLIRAIKDTAVTADVTS